MSNDEASYFDLIMLSSELFGLTIFQIYGVGRWISGCLEIKIELITNHKIGALLV